MLPECGPTGGSAGPRAAARAGSGHEGSQLLAAGPSVAQTPGAAPGRARSPSQGGFPGRSGTPRRCHRPPQPRGTAGTHGRAPCAVTDAAEEQPRGAHLEPVGTRHWQAHLAVSKQRRRVHGHIPRGITISGESANPPGVGKEGKKRYRVVGTWGTCLDALQHPGPPLLAMRIATATSITCKRRAQTVPAARCSPHLYFGCSSFLRG